MAKFDRYMLSQLVVVFGFFALVLVMVYWVNRAVVLFDQLIANGHSATVFLEFSALTLPNVVRIVLPIAAFAAAVFVTNRLAGDSELVVVQSTGYSPFRLARPVLIFGLLVGAMLSVLTHVLVPASLTQLSIRQAEIQNSATARLLREGTFLHPAPGITFYVRDIGNDGVMSDMFLSDSREGPSKTTYTARRALLSGEGGGIKLVMLDGKAQILDRKTLRLSITSFSDFIFDIGPLLIKNRGGALSPQKMHTRDLIWPDPEVVAALKLDRAVLLQVGHERFSQALLAPVVAVIGAAAILLGGFSRFSLWRQMILAVFILVLIKMLDNLMIDTARQDARNWVLVYTAPVVGALTGWAMLWASDRPALYARRRRRREVMP